MHVIATSTMCIRKLHRSDQMKMTECVAYSKTQTHTSGGVVYDDIDYEQ